MGLLRRGGNSEMGMALAGGLANSENTRPQSSQDALDQTLGIGKLLLYDEDTLNMIRSLAFTKQKDGSYLVNPRLAALAIASTYLVRASKLAPVDIEIGIREATAEAIMAKIKMKRAEAEAGGGLIVDAILNSIIIPNYLSSNGGFLAKLTKVSPKYMEVSYREDKGRKAGEGSFAP